MSVKKLSDEIQSIICSSSNISNYKRTVEELVYNSLDAKSTSIAIRIHIQENKIQVVDNGCGIARKDFKLLGQRYATSKYVNLYNFKSIPNTYGFRGQALSSIVNVSKHVIITSRLESSENTWSKSFYAGKEQNFLEVATRPSKGTTVEISGFLHNSKIQSKTINALQELNEIKTFLKQLSLVHSNISLTLRDDSTNEIVFKMHKNRDIYQKIKTLFNIDKIDIQELRVEKNEYKSLAYIGKKCDEMTSHHWIFLNNKIVKNSKLNKLVQQYFTKYLNISGKIKKIKSKFSGDKAAIKKYLPFYIIFLSCPYYDYDISSTPKHSVLEFKNWKPITTLLEKLIKFYIGDISLKETKVQEKPNISPEMDIREKVREITRKFLGSNSKKVGISQMQNGIKGKLIKRRKKKTRNVITKVPLQEASINLKKSINNVMSSIGCENIDIIKTKSKPKHTHKSKLKRPCNDKDSAHFNEIQKNYKIGNSQIVNNNKNKLTDAVKIKPRKTSKPIYETMKKATKRKVDPLIKIFENQPEEVKKRCEILAKKAEDTLHNQKMKQTVTINETVNYSNFVKDNKNISIRKRIGEIIIHDIIPLQKNLKNGKPHAIRQNPFKSSRDLLKTILDSQEVQHYSPNIKVRNNRHSKHFPAFNNHKEIKGLTYQSHNYNKNRDKVMSHHLNKNGVRPDQFVVETPLSPLNVSFNCNKEHKNIHFISKKSRDNFAVPKTFTLKLHKNKTESSRRGCFNFKNVNMNIFNEDVNIINSISNTNKISYTVDEDNNLSANENLAHLDNNMLENTNHNENQISYENVIQHDEMRHSVKSSNFGFTYTITSSNVVMNVDDCSFRNFECDTYLRDDNVGKNTPFHFENCKGENSCKQNQKNIIFVSKSQNLNDAVNCSGNLEPTDVCEAVVHSFDTDYENELLLDCYYNEYNDSLQNFSPPVNEQIQNLSLPDQVAYVGDNIQRLSNIQLSSNNDVLAENNVSPENYIVYNQETPMYNLEINSKAINNENIENNEIDDNDPFTESNYFNKQNIEKDKKSLYTNVFSIRNRSRFLPKGMSPIFENCNSKNICDYNFDKEYFENALYDNFNNDVQTNIEVYEAKVQNTKDVTTKDIEKFNSRLEKDNSTLTFSTKSLKEANVLKQVDNKFITAVLKGDLDSTKYLVIFDQHAVHERIRLEANLSDYFDGNKWSRVNVDDVTLKMTKEEIMYLHNYRDKFNQYGLQWTNVGHDNEIKVHSIPLAVLGKNPREVDKVMKTVKNLISEEISNIISQKGCVSVYPKSIMDLVNNEACRYAIMFGDALSKKECVELLESLSTCKAPFQCAHGRPVMAVVMEFKPEPHDYKINLDNVLKYKTKCITNK